MLYCPVEHASVENGRTKGHESLPDAVHSRGCDNSAVTGKHSSCGMQWISHESFGRLQGDTMTDIRVFIVEDEKIVANDIADTLRSLGYRIAGTAMSGETAVEKIPGAQPDVVLMDIRLAGKMDGVEAAGELQKTSDIPVIYLTAYADKDLLERAKLTEPYGYLVKPYDEHDLQTAIEIALYRHGVQKKLVESESRYRGFVQTFPGVAFRLRNDFSPVFYHGAVEPITGYSATELMAGTPSWNDIVHPDDLPVYTRQNEQIRSISASSSEREYRLIRKDGQIEWVHEIIQYTPGTSGGAPFIQGTLYDVTDRKQAEEALLAYVTEMALRIQQPVEIIQNNLQELVQLIQNGKLSPDEITIVIRGQVRNAAQIAANVQEFQKAIAEKDREFPQHTGNS